jgi:hypothetical protein
MAKTKLLDPVQQPTVQSSLLAPRLVTFDGKVIGLFNNGKLNSAKLLDYVAEALGRHFRLANVVRGSDPDRRRGARPDKELRNGFGFGMTLAGIRGCDAIILANGD